MSADRPVFLKLGGALLTDKAGQDALRGEVLARLAEEIARARPGRALLVAHGSGSFAHRAVRRSRFLVKPEDRLALAVVADSAARLNRHVVGALLRVGLPAVGLPGIVLARADDGVIRAPAAGLVAEFLSAGLLPVAYGDAVLDRRRGGAVASTEPLLRALAPSLGPRRVVLATDVDGVFPSDPSLDPEARPLEAVRRADLAQLALGTARAGATDVTGGMASKVELMLELVEDHPEAEVRVVSGLRPGAVEAALAGDPNAGGTRIVAG